MDRQEIKNYAVFSFITCGDSYAGQGPLFGPLFGGVGYTKVRSPAQLRILTNKRALKFCHIVNWGP